VAGPAVVAVDWERAPPLGTVVHPWVVVLLADKDATRAAEVAAAVEVKQASPEPTLPMGATEAPDLLLTLLEHP